MDDTVLAAMARWPDVPDVRGWLSLSEQGQWRLHPQGDAWTLGQKHPVPLLPGEPIESPQILKFIDRNYAGDAEGRWYFQNGPQKVFVRLDAAPYVLLTEAGASELITHNGLMVETITAWWIDDLGKLYAHTEHGPGMVCGRDAPAVFEALHTADGEPLLRALESSAWGDGRAAQGVAAPATHPQGDIRVALRSEATRNPCPQPAPLHFCATAELASQLGFVPCP